MKTLGKKVLTICERGNSRSVCLSWLLKDGVGLESIACGMRTTSKETMKMLCEWADSIVLVDKTFEPEIPAEFKDKLFIFDVGPDRFFRLFHSELIKMYGDYLKEVGIYGDGRFY